MKTKRSLAPSWGAAVTAQLLTAITLLVPPFRGVRGVFLDCVANLKRVLTIKHTPLAPLKGGIVSGGIASIPQSPQSFAHRRRTLLLCLLTTTTAFAQMTLTGRVVMPDSSAVAFANVTLLGEKQQTTTSGRFSYEISEAMQKRLGVEIGDDLPILVEKEGLVLLQPANGRVRIPRKAMSQEIEIIMAKKGSPLLIKSEAVLENLIQQRVNAAILAEKGGSESLRDVLAEEALRLGFDKDQLRTAMSDYKASLRKSEDAIKRGLAALDDANEAKEAPVRKKNLQEAKNNFHEAIHKDETASRTGHEAEKRLRESYYNLGQAYFNEARYDSAVFFFAKADSAEPNNADKLNMWGGALLEKADYAQALNKFQRAFALDTTAYGRNHPKVATRLNNIALVLDVQGDYEGALEKYNDALKIYKNTLGRVHPNVATTLNNIAFVLKTQGDYSSALEKYNEALRIDESCFGRNHPNVARELNNIGEVLRAQGNYAGALEKHNEALRINESYLGRNHPYVAIQLNNIALVLKAQGDYGGAIEKYNEALKIWENALGRVHPNVETSLSNIALVLKAQGDYTGALEKFKEALRIDEICFGRNHPNVARVLHNIAGVLYIQGDYLDALEKSDEALTINMQFLGPNHLHTKTVRRNRNQAEFRLLNSIGVGYIKQAKADSALIYLQQALPLAQQLNEQKTLGNVYNNLGTAYKLKQDWPQALLWLEKSVSHNLRTQGDSASVLAYTYFHLAEVAHAQSQSARAREYAQKSLLLTARNKLAELQKEVEALLHEIAGREE